MICHPPSLLFYFLLFLFLYYQIFTLYCTTTTAITDVSFSCLPRMYMMLIMRAKCIQFFFKIVYCSTWNGYSSMFWLLEYQHIFRIINIPPRRFWTLSKYWEEHLISLTIHGYTFNQLQQMMSSFGYFWLPSMHKSCRSAQFSIDSFIAWLATYNTLY